MSAARKPKALLVTTPLLGEAFEKASELSSTKQNELARWILAQIAQRQRDTAP